MLEDPEMKQRLTGSLLPPPPSHSMEEQLPKMVESPVVPEDGGPEIGSWYQDTLGNSEEQGLRFIRYQEILCISKWLWY